MNIAKLGLCVHNIGMCIFIEVHVSLYYVNAGMHVCLYVFKDSCVGLCAVYLCIVEPQIYELQSYGISALQAGHIS